MSFLYMILGAALGGVCRHLAMSAVGRCAGVAFPWGTLVVNLAGSLLLGGLFAAGAGSAGASAALVGLVGFCGGFTTFSTFSLQNLTLLSQGARVKLAANIALNVAGCLIAIAAGYTLMEGRGL